MGKKHLFKFFDEDAEITFEVSKESLLTLGEFPKFNNAEMGYLLTDCDMSILFGIEGTSEYIEYSESEQNGRTSYGARSYGLPGYVPDYSDDFTDEILYGISSISFFTKRIVGKATVVLCFM